MRASVHRLLSGAGLTMRSGGGVTIFQVEANADEKDAWLALFDLEDVTPMIELQWTLHQQKDFETRTVAKECFNFVVEHPLTIIKCFPLNHGLRVQLRNCSESDWSIVRTRLLTCGSVKRFNAEESKVSAEMASSMKESCKRRVEQLQNASSYAGCLEVVWIAWSWWQIFEESPLGTGCSRSKKCPYVSLLQDGGSVDSAKWQGLHAKPLWKAVPCERRPGDQVISACMPPLRRHSFVYKSEGPNPSPAHDAERPAVQNNAMEGVPLKHTRTRDMMPRPSQKPSATPPTKSAERRFLKPLKKKRRSYTAKATTRRDASRCIPGRRFRNSAPPSEKASKTRKCIQSSRFRNSKPPSEHAPKPDKNAAPHHPRKVPNVAFWSP